MKTMSFGKLVDSILGSTKQDIVLDSRRWRRMLEAVNYNRTRGSWKPDSPMERQFLDGNHKGLTYEELVERAAQEEAGCLPSDFGDQEAEAARLAAEAADAGGKARAAQQKIDERKARQLRLAGEIEDVKDSMRWLDGFESDVKAAIDEVLVEISKLCFKRCDQDPYAAQRRSNGCIDVCRHRILLEAIPIERARLQAQLEVAIRNLKNNK